MLMRAIQTFKDHFVSALATTDSKFPLQLWDQLAPQVENTLNMLCPLQIDPTMLAYKAVHSPYNWNPQVAKQSFTNHPNHAPHGAAAVPTHGTSGCPSTIINATTNL
jgi:hypothetical protein